jgi:predicted nucleic acid-binding protein
MILIDSSAWIEFIRATGSPADGRVIEAVSARDAATTDVVRLELLAGGYRGLNVEDLATLLDSCTELEQAAREDVESAADIFRRCRRRGETLRAVNDCLLAAVAIRHDVPILHCDKDFDVIALHTELRVVPL